MATNQLNNSDVPGKEQLKITAFSDPGFSSQVGQTLEVMINPTKYKHTHSIEYAGGNQPLGLPDSSKMYKTTAAEKVCFTLLFEGTGAIKGKAASDVNVQVNAFYSLCYNINGSIHRPNFVQIVWGNLKFFGQLTCFDISYTLFKPNGVPIRAEAEVVFEEYIDPASLKAKLNFNSPDITHMRELREGDTLPLLCEEIYGDGSLYVQVAKANRLDSFRTLVPGSKIYFPPLKA